MGITHLCENAHFTYKILQYTCFNCTYYTCSYDKCVWDMSQYNKLSDIQYARFQILPVDLHFGQLVSPPCVMHMLKYILPLPQLTHRILTRQFNAEGCLNHQPYQGHFTPDYCCYAPVRVYRSSPTGYWQGYIWRYWRLTTAITSAIILTLKMIEI